jgi:hypothetical protein
VIAFGWSHPLAASNWEPMSPRVRAAVAACPGQVFNEYDDGGYLVWFVPEKRVFVDGRQDPYPPGFIARAGTLVGDAEARAETFRQYDVRCAALTPRSRMVTALRDWGWRETFRDARWVVLEE